MAFNKRRASHRRLAAPAAQCLRGAADLACDRGHCRLFEGEISRMLANHPNRTVANLSSKRVWGKMWGLLSYKRNSLKQIRYLQ